jgi:pseudouridine kinase
MSTGFIVVVGGANVDIGAHAEQALHPGDSIPGRVHWSPGGVARNVAHNLAHLGHEVRLISAVGDDDHGRALLAATRSAGVDTSRCLVLDGATTASYVSVHDADGSLATAVNDMQVLEQLTAAALEPHAAQISSATALVLDCNLPAAVLGWLFAHCGAAPAFVDAVSGVKCRRVLPWLGRVHTLKVNRLEAHALSGLPAASPDGCEAVAAWLHGRGVARVVLSRGAEALYHSAIVGGGSSPGQATRERGWQPAPAMNVLGTSGAGDALLAGLVHSHLNRMPLAEAVRFGAGCAALTLTTSLANHPDLSVARVERLLNAQAAK